jgi:hypothetical protein
MNRQYAHVTLYRLLRLNIAAGRHTCIIHSAPANHFTSLHRTCQSCIQPKPGSQRPTATLCPPIPTRPQHHPKQARTLHPSPPLSEPGAATLAPAHTRTAVARLGIKIACDLAASPPLPPCARALPSSLFSSHDEKHARIALE